jgi:16S rRNA C967 or C1407 C5-methylase (RsmB/RsmF family)/NOL1/NOP2/fmu family ribosome biogenesis protein
VVPEEFVKRMKVQMGAESDAFFNSLKERPETSILLNPLKPKEVDGEPIPWSVNGRYLKERPSFVEDPLYHAGAYYPQEASSMAIGEIVQHLDLEEGVFCLDLCGAPGGKSLNLLQSLPSESFLVSNEVIKSRVKILIENLRKWGNYNVAISSIHPSEWRKAGEIFDLILVDAPCSGEGMFRKEGGKAIEEWSVDNVRFCAERQESILSDVIPSLRPGGFLIYSTCTYSIQENESIVQKIISQDLLPVTQSWPVEHGFVPIGNDGNAFQAYPHKVRGEGLFFSVFRKEGRSDSKEKAILVKEEEAPIPMRVPKGYRIIRTEDNYYLESTEHSEALDRIGHLRGTLTDHLPLGVMKGKNFIPSHELAMTNLVLIDRFIELDQKRAIQYLRRETFACPETQDGWYLARFETTTLGWIKIASGKMKNHYPKSWMIRKRW